MKTDKVIHMRPSAYAEHMLVTAMLDGTYPPGSTLPGERSLATDLGITRPTLREALQRLSREGWIRIQHGKPSKVRDYWTQGGLSLLGTLADYAQYIPDNSILHLLEIRALFIPEAAAQAAVSAPQKIAACFEDLNRLDNAPQSFAEFDWKWQAVVTRCSGNFFFPLILNDFAPVFKNAGIRYFSVPEARVSSKSFYRKFHNAVIHGEKGVKKIVAAAMRKSIQIWKNIDA
jgi:GntR family negative regulator for fad regulon and positive regulator of fabA